jgi:hypothetical protein
MIKFKDLVIGEKFKYQGYLFFKTSNTDFKNAYNITSLFLDTVLLDSYVKI